MNRRRFLLIAAGSGLAVVLGLKPGDRGAAYSAYFETLNRELRANGPATPALVVDLERLDRNIQALTANLTPGLDYRIVAKSLPSPELIGYIMRKAQTRKVMVFHRPFIQRLADAFPDIDMLVGKPMPVESVRRFYTTFSGTSGFDPARQLQWLIDTPARLSQYHTLARALNVKMRMNLEIDVGLHRGGISAPDVLGSMISSILSDPAHLEFAGLMGYDPHVVKIPGILKSQASAYADSQNRYRQFIEKLKTGFPAIAIDRLCLNGAGSPTIALHKAETVINDMSAGSCLVKPVDFDIPTLMEFQPAAYIATPVLKKLKGTTLPAAEAARGLFARWDPNQQQTFFMYGGKWMARYESPPGLQPNSLYGHSTNQQMVNGSNRVALEVDDHIFLRPNQSEFVFLQFGDLLAVRDGRIVDRWSVLKQ